MVHKCALVCLLLFKTSKSSNLINNKTGLSLNFFVALCEVYKSTLLLLYRTHTCPKKGPFATVEVLGLFLLQKLLNDQLLKFYYISRSELPSI